MNKSFTLISRNEGELYEEGKNGIKSRNWNLEK